MTTEGNGLPWKKINAGIGVLVGIFALIGGVFGAQSYMEIKYAEAEDVEQIVEMVEDGDADLQQLVALNAKSIQLQNYRFEQNIIQDRIDRKKDLKQEVELGKPTTPKEHHDKQKQMNNIERDIEELERDLDSIDKPL